MTFADPVKKAHFAIRFEWGGSTLPNPAPLDIDDIPDVLLLTDDDDGTTIDAEDYEPAVFELKLGKVTGGLDEEETTIELPLGYMPDELSKGPHARVKVLIHEIVDADEMAVVFRGEIFSTIRNPSDHDGTEILKCFSAKKMLSMGQTCMPADDHCIAKLFGKICVTVNTNTGPPNAPTQTATQGPDIVEYIQAAEIGAITGQTIEILSIEDFATIGAGVSRLWEDGFLEYRGLQIKIIEWDDTTQVSIGGGLVSTSFRLSKKPPASWAGQIMRAVPGCNKSIEKCREYDNELNFNGPGYGSLFYNPMIGSPT